VFAGGSGETTSPELVVGVLPDVDSIPLVIADIRGMFADAGVRVRLERFTSPVVRDSAFQAGEVDGVVSDILAAVFAKQAGMDVWITSATDGSYKLLVSPGVDIRSLRELRGRQVGLSRNTVIEYCTDRMLERAGLSAADVEKVAIPQIPVRMEMLNAGKIDAAVLPEPLASNALASGAVLLDSSDRLGIDPGVMLFSGEAVEEKRDALRAFYRAYDEAVVYVQTAPRHEYVDELISAAGFPESVRGALELPDYHPAEPPDPSEVRAVGRWLVEKGVAELSYTVDRLVDASVLPNE
jgi:NitT/TauT family transport system substrate-binding protein